jgi:thiamine-phosphate pyrophosphorylase
MRRLPVPPLLVITDRHQAARPLEDIATAVFQSGGRWLSLREKDLPPPERAALLKRLIAIAAPFNAKVMVHEDLETAATTGAAGVHLPAGGDVVAARARLGERALIGISAHAGDDPAMVAGADYTTISPIFLTASKPGYGPALGLDGLSNACRLFGIPMLALGGINAARLHDCRRAGTAGVAIMGEIMRAHDPGAMVKALLAELLAFENQS